MTVKKVLAAFGALGCVCWALVTVSAAGANDAVTGGRPAYTDRALSDPPNAQAIVARMWVPDIDFGYVPQGLAVGGAFVYLAAYRYGGAPSCRIFRIDRRAHAVTGRVDLPYGCTHAGGLAYAGADRLFVADTKHLFEIDLKQAFDPLTAGNAQVRAVVLDPPLRGSFLAFHGGALWIGEYNKNQPGRIFQVPLAAIDALAPSENLGRGSVVRALDIAPISQGAAFDAGGALWLSQSGSRTGALQKVDATTGAVLAAYAAVPGIEDLGFDDDGLLWAVSEAGSKRWREWPTFYPIVFAIDVRAMR